MRRDVSPKTARFWRPSRRRSRAALAGAAAAFAWGLQEPLDQRLFGCRYSDIELLGKTVTRGGAQRVVGFAIHTVNGAVFGVVFDELRSRVRRDPRKLAIGMALGEHLALYPLFYFVDRPLLTSPRAFAQQTWRHLFFGAVLGRLAA
jgi:hypothetical protein